MRITTNGYFQSLRFRRDLKNKDMWILIAAVLAIGALITLIVTQSSNKKLEVYNDSEKISKVSETTTQANIETQIYTDDSLGFSLAVPEGWNKITKNGYITFVEPTSGAYVQIQTLDYDPKVNNMTEQTAAASIAAQSKKFASFTWKSGNNCELQYQDPNTQTTYDYVEESYISRNNIVKLVCVFSDEDYTKLQPYYSKIIESFAWEPSNPIPDGYKLMNFYDDNGTFDFEVGLPCGWEWTAGSSGYSCTVSDDSGNTIGQAALQMISGQKSLDGINANQLSSLIGNTRQSYIMQSYNSGSNVIAVSGFYIQNNVQIQNNSYLYCDGVNMYLLSFDYEKGTIKDDIPKTCAKLFRSFLSPDSKTASEADRSETKTGSSTTETTDKNDSEVPENVTTAKSKNMEGQTIA